MRYAGYMSYWSPLTGLYIGFGVAALFIVVFIWQVVGIWRSATNYEFENKKWWWSKAAKFRMGLVVVGQFWQL